jgi:hypothetical protein
MFVWVRYREVVRVGRLFGLFALFMMASPVVARAQSVAVLGLTSDDGDDGLATSVTRAVRSEVESDARYEVSSSHVSLAQMTMAQDCEITDAQCRIAIANALKVERVIYGAVHRSSRRTLDIELHMANRRDGTETRATRSLSSRDTSDAAFARVATELLAELRGEPSEHDEAAAPTAVPTVAPKVSPLDDEGNHTAAPVREPTQDSEPGSNDWIGYTLIGVAVAATAMTAVSWMQIDKAQTNPGLATYRKAVDYERVKDACDEAEHGSTYGVSTEVLDDARSACRQGRTFEVLQYVFLGTAIASAGVGAYFLLDDDGVPESAASARRTLALIPRVSTHDAALDLRVRF